MSPVAVSVNMNLEYKIGGGFMRIGIIGGGAIGLLFACYLSKSNQVTLYCRTNEQVRLINKYGIYLKHHGTVDNFTIKAQPSDEISAEDLFIIAVKQYQLEQIERVFHHIPSQTPLIFIQNGVAHLKFIENLSHEIIIVGVVEHGALKEKTNYVHHTGEGLTRLAIFRGNEQFVGPIIHKLNTIPFPFIFEKDYLEMVFGKLIVNAVINPLTAILKAKNGELMLNSHYLHLVHLVLDEVVKILDISDREKVFMRIKTICENTASNQSSMLKDILNHRQTEIDGIIGGLLNMAETKDLKVPVLQFLYHSIKGMER